MNVSIEFLGGAGTVTGSKHLIRIGFRNVLLDCGLFQGLKELRLQNWEGLPIANHEIDAVVLSHAHLDHSGYLPRLVKHGYKGPIYCTQATADLLKILLMDSAKLQEEDALFAKKKGFSKHKDPLPLYDQEDALAVFPLLSIAPFNSLIEILPDIKIRFQYAGHILGAASVELKIKGDEQEKTIVFSGDLGHHHDPLLFPPVKLPYADVILVESTHAMRDIPYEEAHDQLSQAINETLARKGIPIIPAFSVGRTQDILIMLKDLMFGKMIPEVPIYMDSPMATAATEIYARYPELLKVDMRDIDNDPSFKVLRRNLRIVHSASESKALNSITEPCIMLSASGMLTGGRVLHHLYNRLPIAENAVILVGFQPVGTRGRNLLNGDPTIRIFGQDVAANAKVYNIKAMSAHADRDELLDWLSGFSDKPKIAFAVHGEEDNLNSLQHLMEKEFGWNAVVPKRGMNYAIFEGI
jgi:metallo-beta-lactamase family protein